MTPIDLVLGLLEKARQTGEGYTALCPAHDDRDPSLSIRTGTEGKALLKCHAGCATPDVLKAIGLSMNDLFPRERRGEGGPPTPKSRETDQPLRLTAEQYATDKGLPIEFLSSLGVETLHLGGVPTVKIPYYDEQGDEYRVRFRKAGSSFSWRSRDKKPLIPYGVWLLEVGSGNAAEVVIVEGESDAQTLLHHGVPALGVPGASTWKPEWEKFLDGFAVIYLFVEPDQGGKALMKSLSSGSLRERIRIIRPGETDHKDPSDMHVADPDGFLGRFRQLMADAVPLVEIEAAEKEKSRNAAASLAMPILAEPDILGSFCATLRALGVAGEETAAKLLYLVFTSRLLDQPVSAVVVGPSSAGKSYLVEQVLRFFPEAGFLFLTAMSDKFLAHFNEPLSHRHLVIAEAAGMKSDTSEYLVRSLLSESCVSYGVVEKGDDGKLHSVRKQLDGPTGLVMTTTASKIHPENATRLFEIPVTDTPDQTRAINLVTGRRHSGLEERPPDLAPWVAFQDYLSAGPTQVVIPFAQEVAQLTSDRAVRMRRSLNQVLLLTGTRALIHQQHRKRDAKGRVVATLDDYEAVRELVLDIVGEAVSSSVTAAIRQTVQAVAAIRDELGGSFPVTNKQLEDKLDIGKSAVSRRVSKAIDLGYLVNEEAIKGKPMKLKIGDPMPEDQAALPTVEELTASLGKAEGEYPKEAA